MILCIEYSGLKLKIIGMRDKIIGGDFIREQITLITDFSIRKIHGFFFLATLIIKEQIEHFHRIDVFL